MSSARWESSGQLVEIAERLYLRLVFAFLDLLLASSLALPTILSLSVPIRYS
jgi:hypothetical protein